MKPFREWNLVDYTAAILGTIGIVFFGYVIVSQLWGSWNLLLWVVLIFVAVGYLSSRTRDERLKLLANLKIYMPKRQGIPEMDVPNSAHRPWDAIDLSSVLWVLAILSSIILAREGAPTEFIILIVLLALINSLIGK
jgi:hypothetical protein